MRNSQNEKHTSLGKAILLLREVGRLSKGNSVKLGELVDVTGIHKATAHRLLAELRSYGLIEQLPANNTYRLGQLVLALAAAYHASLDLRERALETLRVLADETVLTAHLAVRDGDEVVYIEKVETSSNVRIASGIGWRGKLHCTSLGKALLAYGGPELIALAVKSELSRQTPRTIVSRSALEAELALTRERGYALDDCENQPEVRCIGAPVFDRNGQTIGAISVSGTTLQLPKRNVPEIGEIVRSRARSLSQELGYTPPTAGTEPGPVHTSTAALRR